MQVTAFQQLVLSLTVPMATRAIFGPFPFLVSFAFGSEWLKISYSLYAALSNFSAGLQLCYIADIRWLVLIPILLLSPSMVTNLEDSKVAMGASVSVLLHILTVNGREYVLVSLRSLNLFPSPGQMYLGLTPLLTRGPLALMYGGEAILDHLSTRSPDRGFPCLALFSTLFQLCLYITKKVRSRGDGAGYLDRLRQTLVESATNIYGLIVLVGCFLVTSTYALHHVWTIRRNRDIDTKSLTPSLLPLNVALLLATMAFITLLPFCTKHALRCPLSDISLVFGRILKLFHILTGIFQNFNTSTK